MLVCLSNSIREMNFGDIIVMDVCAEFKCYIRANEETVPYLEDALRGAHFVNDEYKYACLQMSYLLMYLISQVKDGEVLILKNGFVVKPRSDIKRGMFMLYKL